MSPDEPPRERDWGDEPEPPPPRRRRDRADPDAFYEYPHRGGLILGLGVAGLVMCNCCPFLGLGLGAAAWTLGNGDLARMDAREMDPAGRSNTHAGKVCGVAGVILGIAYTLLVGAQLALQFALGR